MAGHSSHCYYNVLSSYVGVTVLCWFWRNTSKLKKWVLLQLQVALRNNQWKLRCPLLKAFTVKKNWSMGNITEDFLDRLASTTDDYFQTT